MNRRKASQCIIMLILGMAVIAAGCRDGTNQIAKEELDRIQMRTYQKGNQRQAVQGKTLNKALLYNLVAESAKRGIRLTKETYAETLDGTISYNYLINSDPRHFVIVYVYPSEEKRVREMAEIYGTGGIRVKAANQPAVIAARGRTVFVYGSNGMRNQVYTDHMRAVFEDLLDRIANP
ncbi:hypothetical protein [Paenibacillus ihumii]|uniref:hypothetical protein n=1 Tax=Paenibacillus ihumii TaxID=687436 RepID=UPI000AA89737|nr:hypothetical protein [Paenibacillus ihumii]